jgi:flagellar hook assembly protein FlgD
MLNRRGPSLLTTGAATPRPFRRRALIAATVVLGLAIPSASMAVAAGADPSPAGAKRQLLEARKTSVAKGSRVAPAQTGTPLQRVAAGSDSDNVAFAVKVRGGAAASASIDAVSHSAKSYGGSQRRVLNKLGTVSVEVPEKQAEKFVAKLRARADVASVKPIARRDLGFVPNDAKYSATAPYLDAIAAPSAWDVHRGDPAVTIAVVDSGVDVNHQDLSGRVNGTYNAVTHTSDVTDELGHGTFVAGVAAATGDNGVGIAGASMGATVMAVKVADSNNQIFTDAEADGIIWAVDHGAQVINLSLGSAGYDQLETDAVAYAVANDVLVVAAAGNDGTSTPNYPAALPNVVAVGATDAAGQRASFSQHGSWVTVAAPGTDITGTAPVAGSDFFSPEYDVSNGTSFSTPLVSAEAALLWSSGVSVTADEVRAAIVASAHGYAGLGLGAGQVDFRAAYEEIAPDTTPSLIVPTDGATVTGDVTLAASSTAPKVRFLVDGAPTGSPVPVADGATSMLWKTWGLSNGGHTVGAVDCTTADVCSTAAAEVAVTVANDAPVVTSPTAGQTLGGTATFTATAPGGAVAFVIDGVQRGLDTTSPYSLSYSVSSLADGTHSVQALSCPTSGVCDGPASSAVSFKALSLHPRFTSVAPSVFSPNKDGRYDGTRATYYLPDTETVRFQVRNSAGTIVRGPLNLGTKAKGTYSYVWNGLFNSGARAANGTYKVELVTSRTITGSTLRGSAIGSVRVDLSAPTLSSISGGGTRFYPYRDSYRDNFSPAFTVNEKSTVTLTVKTSAGKVVGSLSASKSAGRTSLTWNGRNNAGSMVAGGTYYWTLTAQDVAGNRRTSARYSVIVSSKRLVSKTATLSRNGSSFVSAGGSDGSCADASTALSDYTYGVWLTNFCDPFYYGTQIAGAIYRFTLPTAVSYSSLRVDSYGYSLDPATIGAAFTRWGTDDYTFTHEISTPLSDAWRTIGSVSPTGVVNSSRVVETTVFLPNTTYLDTDYDIAQVRLVVSYKVLV